jgi:hypothetical protein
VELHQIIRVDYLDCLYIEKKLLRRCGCILSRKKLQNLSVFPFAPGNSGTGRRVNASLVRSFFGQTRIVGSVLLLPSSFHYFAQDRLLATYSCYPQCSTVNGRNVAAMNGAFLPYGCRLNEQAVLPSWQISVNSLSAHISVKRRKKLVCRSFASLHKGRLSDDILVTVVM